MFGRSVTRGDVEVFEQGLLVSQLRGDHSTGVGKVMRNGKESSFMKRACDPYEFLTNTKGIQGFLHELNGCKVLLGHNRWATYGDVNNSHAHPFSFGKPGEEIMLAHNGGITNHSVLSGGKNFQVDSEALAYAVHLYGIENTLQRAYGSWALTFYDAKDRSFNLIRNEDRPLWIAKESTDQKWYYASERMMLEWILWRNKIKIDPPELIKKDVLYKFDIKKVSLSEVKLDLRNGWERKMDTSRPKWPATLDEVGDACGMPSSFHGNSRPNSDTSGTAASTTNTETVTSDEDESEDGFDYASAWAAGGYTKDHRGQIVPQSPLPLPAPVDGKIIDIRTRKPSGKTINTNMAAEGPLGTGAQVLAKMDLKPKDLISFTLNRFEAYPERHTSGNGYGVLFSKKEEGHVKVLVRAYGVSRVDTLGLNTGMQVLMVGQILSYWWSPEENAYIIGVVETERYTGKQERKLPRIKADFFRTPAPASNHSALPAANDNNGQGTAVIETEDKPPLKARGISSRTSHEGSKGDGKPLQGFADRELTVLEFNRLTKHGCCGCSADISVEDAHNGELMWLDYQSPLCAVCAENITDGKGNLKWDIVDQIQLH